MVAQGEKRIIVAALFACSPEGADSVQLELAERLSILWDIPHDTLSAEIAELLEGAAT